ncbi:hypothetical protein RB200_09070 [Streptomyces sp. PmtG]
MGSCGTGAAPWKVVFGSLGTVSWGLAYAGLRALSFRPPRPASESSPVVDAYQAVPPATRARAAPEAITTRARRRLGGAGGAGGAGGGPKPPGGGGTGGPKPGGGTAGGGPKAPGAGCSGEGPGTGGGCVMANLPGVVLP